MIFSSCKKREENNTPSNSNMSNIDVVVDKKWWLSATNGLSHSGLPSGFMIASDNSYYLIEECQELLQPGNWHIEQGGMLNEKLFLNHQYFDTTYQLGVLILDTVINTLGRVKSFSESSFTLVNENNSTEYVFTSNFQERCTYIPDDKFEQIMISLGHDDVMDNYIKTSNIDSITTLHYTLYEGGIYDLTGIEGFSSLTELNVAGNYIESLDLSHNDQLEIINCADNQILHSLILGENPNLIELYCGWNELTHLDISKNINLQKLYIGINNIIDIDLSNNVELTHFISDTYSSFTSLDFTFNNKLNTLVLSADALTELSGINHFPPLLRDLEITYCPLLESLDLRTGHGMNLSYFSITNSDNLTCIDVDDMQYFYANWGLNIDPHVSFSHNCP